MSNDSGRLSLREQGFEREQRRATKLADGMDHQVLNISGQGREHRHTEKASRPGARNRRGVFDYADGC